MKILRNRWVQGSVLFVGLFVIHAANRLQHAARPAPRPVPDPAEHRAVPAGPVGLGHPPMTTKGDLDAAQLPRGGKPAASAPLGRLALLWRLVLLCAGIRVVLEIIGMASLAARGQSAWSGVLAMWNQWDGAHYLRLAETGYLQSSPPPNTDDQFFIVFYPLFPLAVHLVSLAVLNLLLSALVVSFAASVGAGYFLFRLVALDADEATAWRAVALLFSFPTAYYLAAPFTEALFLFAVLASVHAARTGSWARAGLAGALATGTRVTGIVLIPALVVEAFTTRVARERVRRLAWIAVAGAGFLTYLAINQIIYGDVLHFLRVQRDRWQQQAVPPWQPIHDAIAGLAAGGNDVTFMIIYAGRIACVVLALPLLALAIRRSRPADAVFGWSGLVLLLSASWLISLPRYLLVLYPLFMVGAHLTRSPRAFVPVVVAGAVLQAWLMWRFAGGEWTF